MKTRLTPVRLARWVALPMAHTSEVERRLTMILDSTRSRRQTTRRILFAALGLGTAALLPLAALHPAARAQTAEAPTPPPEAAEAGAMPGGPSAAVPVTLAGVTDATGPGGEWWGASGVPLARPVFDTAEAYERATVGGSPGQRSLIFAFRLPPSARNVTTALEAPGQSSSSSGVWPGKMQGQENLTEATLNRDTEGVRTLAAIYPVSASKASLRVGVAAGPWQVSESRTLATGATSHAAGQDFILSPVVETAKGLVLTITTDSTEDVRVVAVDAQGRELLPTSIGGQSINALDQITAQFSQPLAQIKAFRVETRPFTWTEFKDVALQPSGQQRSSRPVLEAPSAQRPSVPALFTEGPEGTTARRLQQIGVLIQLYRTTHGGAYPAAYGPNSLLGDIAAHPQAYGPDQGADSTALAIPYFTSPGTPRIAYFLHGRRPGGTPVGTAKRAGTRDVLAYTNLYVRNQSHGPTGFYLVLWDDGTVSRVPASQALAVPAYDVIGPAGATEVAARQGEKQVAFPGQAGLPSS